jgi:uncharacterized membrane protein YedE/YeeE
MSGLTSTAIGLAGLGVGAIAGFTAKRVRFCFLGAMEAALEGGDWRRIKVLGLAIAVAIAGSQALILAGLFDPGQSTYVPARIPWFSIGFGSIVFGVGMALVGTCAFGSLVRLGGGDLRSLVTLLIFGAVAYALLRGVLAGWRVTFVEAMAFDMPNGTAGSFADLLAFAGGTDWPIKTASGWRLFVTASIVVILTGIVARDRRLWRAPRLMLGGVVLGLCVVAGWIFTGVLADEFENGLRVQSLTFVAPVARALYAAMLATSEWTDFGVTSVWGVVIGAFVAAQVGREFRWEAFDDHREMRKHLLGAVLMGAGGVLAGGCTIGQGMTAGSLLAISWPIAFTGMTIGARLGLLLLVEGSLREAIGSRVWLSGRR